MWSNDLHLSFCVLETRQRNDQGDAGEESSHEAQQEPQQEEEPLHQDQEEDEDVYDQQLGDQLRKLRSLEQRHKKEWQELGNSQQLGDKQHRQFDSVTSDDLDMT